MKNVKLIVVLLISSFILIISGLGLLYIESQKKPVKIKTPEKEIKKTVKETVKKEKEKPKYYKEEFKERYEAYKKAHPEVSEDDAIIYVNLYLDKDQYSDTEEAQLTNDIRMLVNKHYSLPEGYEPENLEAIGDEFSANDAKLVKEAKDAFVEMASAAKTAGFTVKGMSGYRNFDNQRDLYNLYLSKNSQEKVDTYSARPGFSEHQTGLAIDVYDNNSSYINFDKSPSFGWMKDHAHEYGFILRYPEGKESITRYSFEAWHYRYVGKEIAVYIHDNNITFDEYYAKFIEPELGDNSGDKN